MEPDLIPVGTTVQVTSHLVAEDLVCQVIDIEVNKHTGEVLYELGYFTPRRGVFHRIPKKRKLHHLTRRDALQVLSEFPTTESSGPA